MADPNKPTSSSYTTYILIGMIIAAIVIIVLIYFLWSKISKLTSVLNDATKALATNNSEIQQLKAWKDSRDKLIVEGDNQLRTLSNKLDKVKSKISEKKSQPLCVDGVCKLPSQSSSEQLVQV